MTDGNAVDGSGHFLRGRDCVVALRLTGIDTVELSERTFPAIISDLIITRDDAGWILGLPNRLIRYPDACVAF